MVGFEVVGFRVGFVGNGVGDDVGTLVCTSHHSGNTQQIHQLLVVFMSKNSNNITDLSIFMDLYIIDTYSTCTFGDQIFFLKYFA